MKTIAIDFDGVIHKYSKGWQDGSIYDEPIEGAIKAINDLVDRGFSVFIFSTRPANQIKNWLKQHSNKLLYHSKNDFLDMYAPMIPKEEEQVIIDAENNNWNILQFKVKKIWFWTKFWNNTEVIGITNKKLPAHLYLDDRSLCFNGDWKQAIDDIYNFRTYQEKE